MARYTEPDCAPAIYDCAAEWANSCVLRDGSVLDPSASVWSTSNIQDLIQRLGTDQPEADKFETKLDLQLSTASREVRLLAAEALMVHVLITMDMKPATKMTLAERPLSHLTEVPVVPARWVEAFAGGLIHPGTAFQTFRPNQVQFVLESALAFKDVPDASIAVREDPWRFKEILSTVPVKSAYSQMEALLHLVHPDTFEAIVSRDHKLRIATRFAHLVSDQKADVDRRLAEIRAGLSEQFGTDPGVFYRTAAKAIWQGEDAAKWAEFLSWARRFRDDENFDDTETVYKLEVAKRMGEARLAVEQGDPGWVVKLRRALGSPNNLTTWRQNGRFITFCEGSPAQAREALQELWDEGSSVTQRVNAFCDATSQTELGGPGEQANLVSVLLMGVDPKLYPPFRAEPLGASFKLTGFPPPETGASPAERYAHALEFFDRMLLHAAGLGISLRDRLDAQSVSWAVTRIPGDSPPVRDWSGELRSAFFAYRGELSESLVERAEEGEGRPGADWDAVADACYMQASELLKIREQLLRRNQLVFYGPPGTGKTFIAQKIAEAFVGETGGATKLIQFHASYAYEDFIEGLKPKLTAGQLQYVVEPGILLEFARAALGNQEQRFVLIVDEMNRANLAKVFGELFFLLEYRDAKAELPYSKERFGLPPNLYIIGTMNTADRSIAVVDFALRRRFGFIPFFPEQDQAVLRAYLARNAPELSFVADMLARLNEWIGDRNYMLGHSYFMPNDPTVLNEKYLRDMWRYSIEPHLEEYWYDEQGQLAKCKFDVLRQAVGMIDGGGEEL